MRAALRVPGSASREGGIFHHLITLPTYHTAALSTENLAKEYFGDQSMLVMWLACSVRKSGRASLVSSTRICLGRILGMTTSRTLL